MRDMIAEILTTAGRNKLRTALTGFSVAWGIFIIIFLLGAGNGLLNAIMQNSGQFLDNSMMVFGGYTSKPYDGLKEGRRIELNDNDITATGNNFSGNVETTGAEISQSGVRIAFGDEYVSGNSLCGTYPNKADINKISMLYGRFVNMTDIREQRKTIVLSEGQAKELAPHDIQSLVGKTVDVGGLAFRVAGIYKDDNSRMNTDAYTAFTTLRAIYSRGDKADRIFFTFTGLNTMDENEKFESAYRAGINRNHRAAPDDEEAVWLWNRFTQNLQMNQGTDIIRTALWIIGLFTLLSGVVEVSNIMLITVKERTHEFGIRKAIGASPWSILRLIITESIIITTFFGYIGMVLGIAANMYMDTTIGNQQVDTGLFQAAMFVDPTVGLDVCIQATLVMIVAGTVAGFVPARRAAHIRPIEALRAE